MTKNSTDEKRLPFDSTFTFTLAGPAIAAFLLRIMVVGISSSPPDPACLNSTLDPYAVLASSFIRVKTAAVVDRVKT